MKVSMFNVCVPYEGKVILYNSLSRKLFLTSDMCFLALRENGQNFQEHIDNDVRDKLIQYGFLVEERENEIKQRDLAYYQMIMDSTLSLTIMTTYQCNFRCKYCYEQFQDISLNERLNHAIELYVQKHLRYYKGLNIRWFGGEPLLKLNTITSLSESFIKVCNQLRRSFDASITTNGYLLTQQVFEMLLRNHVRVFQVTIDGTKELHDKYRVLLSGSGSFGKIISNLRSIRDNVKSQAFSIIIRTNCTVESLEHMSEYLDFMSREFSGDNRFSLLFKTVENWGGKSVESMDDVIGFPRQRLYDVLCKYKGAINYDSYVWEINSAICYAGRKNDYVISPEGYILKCTVNLYNDKNIIGRLNDNGTMSIDKGKEVQWLIRYSGNMCEGCRLSAKCYNGQCPAGSFLAADQVVERCEYDQLDIENYLKLIMTGCGKLSRSIEVI